MANFLVDLNKSIFAPTKQDCTLDITFHLNSVNQFGSRIWDSNWRNALDWLAEQVALLVTQRYCESDYSQTILKVSNFVLIWAGANFALLDFVLTSLNLDLVLQKVELDKETWTGSSWNLNRTTQTNYAKLTWKFCWIRNPSLLVPSAWMLHWGLWQLQLRSNSSDSSVNLISKLFSLNSHCLCC